MICWATLEPETLRAAIGGDRAKARAACAAIGAAAAAPGADPAAMRARMAVAREILAPGSSPFSSARGEAAAKLLFATPGTRPFEVIGGRFFRKEIVHAGMFVHPADGSEVSFTPARLEAIARTTNRYLNAVGRIPCPDGHRYDAAGNLGWWHAVEYDAATNSLYGLVEVTNDAVAARIGGDIRDVSMVLSPAEVDSYGRAYEDVITHVCATSYPVIPDQRNFEPLELARAIATSAAVYVPAACAAPIQEDDPMQLSKSQLTLMGLTETSKPEEIDAAIAKAFGRAPAAPATPPAPPPSPAPSSDPKVLELSRTVKEQGEALELAKKALKDRDDADLQTLVDQTKTEAAAAGIPTAFGADQEKVVRTLWGVDKAQAKTAAAGFAQAAGKRADAPAGVKPLPAIGGDADAKKALTMLETRATLAEGEGRRIEWSKDRKELTIHPFAHERAKGAKATTYRG